MSDKLIDISENVGLWVNANGKYGIQSGGRETTITDAEFNRLALEAPLFKKVVDYLNTYSHNNVGRQLLAEIAELEKK